MSEWWNSYRNLDLSVRIQQGYLEEIVGTIATNIPGNIAAPIATPNSTDRHEMSRVYNCYLRLQARIGTQDAARRMKT